EYRLRLWSTGYDSGVPVATLECRLRFWSPECGYEKYHFTVWTVFSMLWTVQSSCWTVFLPSEIAFCTSLSVRSVARNVRYTTWTVRFWFWRSGIRRGPKDLRNTVPEHSEWGTYQAAPLAALGYCLVFNRHRHQHASTGGAPSPHTDRIISASCHLTTC